MKKYIAGAAAILILAGLPQVFAAEKVIVFGSEFADPVNEKQEVRQEVEAEPVKENPGEVANEPVADNPVEVTSEPTKKVVNNPVEEVRQNLNEVVSGAEETVYEKQSVNDEFEDDELGDSLNFNDLTKPQQSFEEIDEPVNISQRNFDEDNSALEIDEPAKINSSSSKKSASRSSESSTAKKTGSTHKVKARFVKVAIDDTYDYYLDRKSIAWKRLPYTTDEYMADVWIRMIEHSVDTSALPPDMQVYVSARDSGEIRLAREKNIEFDPVDIKVLSNKKYYLEHYYLRPARNQIQFLCELEVIGHPQNAISERAYDSRHWENLIPGSVESAIYEGVIKEIGGKSKASKKSRMTFADYVEEYTRISIR